MKRTRAFKLIYCLAILSMVLPIGLAGSGWVHMTIGGGLAMIPVLGPLLMLALGVGRVWQVWRHPGLLDAPAVTGGLRQVQALGVMLIGLGALAGIANWLSIPVARMFVKDPGPNGILFYVGGVYLAMLGALGPLGLLIFETTRLMGFERTHQASGPAATAAPASSERPTFNTMGLDKLK